MTDEEKHKLQFQELEALNKKWLFSQQLIKLYQARVSATYSKKLKVRTFKKGDLNLAIRRPILMTHMTQEKF